MNYLNKNNHVMALSIYTPSVEEDLLHLTMNAYLLLINKVVDKDNIFLWRRFYLKVEDGLYWYSRPEWNHMRIIHIRTVNGITGFTFINDYDFTDVLNIPFDALVSQKIVELTD